MIHTSTVSGKIIVRKCIWFLVWNFHAYMIVRTNSLAKKVQWVWSMVRSSNKDLKLSDWTQISKQKVSLLCNKHNPLTDTKMPHLKASKCRNWLRWPHMEKSLGWSLLSCDKRLYSRIRLIKALHYGCSIIPLTVEFRLLNSALFTKFWFCLSTMRIFFKSMTHYLWISYNWPADHKYELWALVTTLWVDLTDGVQG